MKSSAMTQLSKYFVGFCTLLQPAAFATETTEDKAVTFSTFFTKTADEAGNTQHYIDLDPTTKNFIATQDNRLHKIQKVRFDPFTMTLDLDDKTFGQSLHT